MPTIQLMCYCENCQKPTLHIQQKPNHILHLLLSLITFGFWLIIWGCVMIVPGDKQCTSCGKGRNLWFIAIIALFLAAIYFTEDTPPNKRATGTNNSSVSSSPETEAPVKNTSPEVPPVTPSIAKLSIDQKRIIETQIKQNWMVPLNTKHSGMTARLKISIAQNGSITNVSVIDKSLSPEMEITPENNQQALSSLEAFTNAAVNAVKNSSPLLELSPKEYDKWRELELNFDPPDLFVE